MGGDGIGGKIMMYRLAKRGETQTPRYGVWTPEEYDGDGEFPKTHEGLEQAIELANIFKSFVVAENADCTSETVWTHPELKAASDKERCAYYERGPFHGA